MQYTNRALQLIKKYEGLATKAYKCPANIWTIGYGHTEGVKADDVITEVQAEALLKKDLAKVTLTLNSYLDSDDIVVNNNQFDALISLAYNIGFKFVKYNLWNELKNKNYKQCAKEFLDINKANGIALRGLTLRRTEEAKLFLTND